MPGAVDVIGEAAASLESVLVAERRQRKRKGPGRGRKGKRRCGEEWDRGGCGGFEGGEAVGVEAFENGDLCVVMGDGAKEGNGAFCAIGGVGMEVNGFEHTRVRELDINASPDTGEEEGRSEDSGDFCEPRDSADSVVACGGKMIKLEPDASSGPNQEMVLVNGWDAGTHANGDALSKDVKDTPVEGPKKKRRFAMKELGTPDMPLRRSARRTVVTTMLFPPSADFSSKNVPEEKPASEKKFSDEISEEIPVLPPSSKDLELDGLAVLDVFSVYACLRSFSTLLFLSPFSLKTFVAALKCNFANSLIDSVHYSILQALRPHLEVLSEEGSQFASDCLGNLNWELLDTINWPLYLAEYLLVHHSAMSTGLKLLNGEYYAQPVAKKLEILRNLCDDVIEIEIIRSELNRRMESEVIFDSGQNVHIEDKVKDVSMSDLQSPLSSKEVFEETSDGNNDECCLCRMDGSLICCDGCPAAFHMRCVGMSRDLLPEGKWFCPECLVGKVDRDVKTSKPFQGAEILGIDAYGRIYFGSCGYLLVSESSDMNTSYRYYDKDDLNSILELLKASDISHARIICSILVHWGIPIFSHDSGFHIGQDGHEEYMDVSKQLASQMVSSLNDELTEGENTVENEQHMNSTYFREHGQSRTVLESCKIDSATTSHLSGLACPDGCSEGSAASGQAHGCNVILMSQRSEATCSTNSPNTADIDLSSKCCELMQEKHNEPPNLEHALLAPEKTYRATEVHLELGDYVNCYSFGRIVSSVAELISKSSDKITKDCKVSVEDVMSTQLRAIYKKSINHYWSAIQKLPVSAQKESCGWCFVCKNAIEQECLFRMIENKMLVGSRNRAVGLQSKDNRKSHILYVVHHILHIEDNIHGLLSGPWQNPHHKKQWRKNVLKAADVTSLKYLLLTLELHLRRIALSAEWMKSVDSSLTVGSASYVLTTERGGSRKHPRKNSSETKRIPDSGFCSLSNCASTLGIYWWRGGRLSRQVFHWKLLPRSLASKGARQAGCRKIPGVLYPEGSEFAKRSKCVAWRAAVELSQNVAQLTYQVKDLDSNIRWSDLSNSQPLPQLVKEFRKSIKPLWKATICQKCVEGAHVKYLLDFGKRKSMPDVVAKHGVLQGEPSSEMKYWLDETHIPINLLKAFEARNLEQMLKRTGSEMVSSEGSKYKIAKPRRKRGLSHLLSRGEKSDQNLCGHCDKVVLGREEAVKCQFCKGLIHKKHFRVPKGAITTTYTCYACKDKKFLNESKENKIPDGCKDKKYLYLSEDKKPVDGRRGKKFFSGSENKKRVDQCKGKKLMIDGKDKKGVGKDDFFLLERKDKGLVDRCKVKKLSNKRTGKKIADGYRNKKSVDGCKGKKFVNDFRDKKLESGPKKGMAKLGKNAVLIIRKSDRLAKKKLMVAKSKNRKVGCKKAKQSKTRNNKRVVSKMLEGISWHKGHRTGICPPYWLNGFLWTRKAYDEHAVHFRETRVLLPFPNSKDNLQPVCSLCHKEYDSHAIYVSCETCGDWFHGDAFALTLVNINNIRGFKCHRCCTKSTPVCPYLSGGVDEVKLLKEKSPSFNHLGDYHRLPCLVYDNQDLLHDHDQSDVVHSQKFMDEDQRAVAIPDSWQIPISKECNETTSEIGPGDGGLHLVSEHSCLVHEEVNVVGEDHPL